MSRLKTNAAALAPARWPWAGLGAGLVWLLAAASMVHWGLRLFVQGRGLPSQVQTVGVAQALQGDSDRLFARAAVAVPAAAASPARDRFRVQGVAAAPDAGWALLSVDGKPPRAYRLGAAVDSQWVVLAITQRRLDIGPPGGPATVTLDLPALPAAATGSLPSTPSNGATVPLLTPPPALPGGAMPPSGNEPMSEAPMAR